MGCSKDSKTIKVTLNQDACINCGTCTAICPKVFGFDDKKNKHKVLPPYNKSTKVDKETYQKIKDAETACPVMAIKVIEEKKD